MAGIEALLTGRVLGDRYRIEAVIGRGGMGAVYRATDERLGREVALKVITVATDPDARDRVRARFRHEAASAARLPHHPNVVPVYDYGTDAQLGLDYIVMELLRGEDLATRLARSGPPPLGPALRILRETARGVAVGHRAGLIHRDVKPGNVFLVNEDDPRQTQVRVLDFGIAKAVADEDTQTALTMDGRAPLSPGYASPEQLRGDARLTPSSDVFSLGTLGYQLLTGQRPFSELDRNRMSAGMEVPVPSVRARNPAVPELVEAIIRRALTHDPDARFPTAADMAEALDEAIRDLTSDVAAARVPAGAAALPAEEPDRTMLADAPAAAAAAAAASGPQVPTAEPEPRPVISSRRHPPEQEKGGGARWVLGGAVALALAAGGVLAFQQVGSSGEQPEYLSDLPDSAHIDSAPPADSSAESSPEELKRAGMRALQSGDWETAEQQLMLAVMLLPQDVQARDAYAFALLNLGRAAEAERVLLEAQRIDPGYDLTYSHLASALLAQGDSARAITALERFISTTLDRGARDEAIRRLEALRTAAAAAAAAAQAPPPEPEPARPPDTLRIPTTPRDTLRLPSTPP